MGTHSETLPGAAPAPRPSRSVAIVGSGPAAMFALERLRREEGLQVDVFERWPFPFGLVRYGVAPDHQGVKNIRRRFQLHLEAPNVRFLGGVEVGKDISLAEVRGLYDAVVLGVGSPVGARLGIEGEDLPQVWSASRFAGWFNAEPGCAATPPLGARVCVVGQGNVGIDVARVLLHTAEGFDGSDLWQGASEALGANPVSSVSLVGRRGAAQAKFTTPELKELCRLAGVSVAVEGATAADLGKDLGALAEAGLEASDMRRVRGNLETFAEYASGGSGEGEGGARRSLRFLFGARPAAFVEQGGRLAALRIERMVETAHGRFEPTGEFREEACDFAVSCIGYRVRALEGVPLDAKRGVYQNRDGRIDAGLWAVGWCGRGPSGAIASNRKESHGIMEALLAELGGGGATGEGAGGARGGAEGADALLAARGVRPVSTADWNRIEQAEEERAPEGRVREKFIELAEAARLLGRDSF